MIPKKTKDIIDNAGKKDPATTKAIDSVEKELNISFPDDYKDVLLYSNGFTGAVGEDGWFDLWKIENLLEMNAQYGFLEQLPGIIVIGSNQGGFYYGIDLRNKEVKYIMVDPIGMKDDLFNGGSSFEELLEMIGKGTLERIKY